MRATPDIETQYSSNDGFPRRFRLSILLGLSVLALAAFLGYLVIGLAWRSTPFMGVMVDHNMVVTDKLPNGDTAWAGLDAGLQPGDQILSINGQAISRVHDSPRSSRNYQDVLGTLRVNSRVTVEFYAHDDGTKARPGEVSCQATDGGARLCEVTYALAAFPMADFTAFFITPYVAGLIVLIVGLAVLYVRRWDPAAFLIVVIIELLALFMAGLFDLHTTHHYLPLWILSSALLGGSLITLGLIFPAPVARLYRQPWLRFIPIVLSGLLALYALIAITQESAANAGANRYLVETFVFVSMAILAALLHAYQRPHATTALARDQAISVMIGVMLGLVPTGFWFVAGLTQSATGELLFPFSVEVSMLFFVVLPFSMAYAALEVRYFDGDRMLVRAVSYSLMLFVLMLGYFLVVVGASLFTTGIMDANNPFLVIITIFFISVLFVPLRTQLQGSIEHVYFRTRRNYQQKLEAFSRQLTSLAGTDVMVREFRRLLAETIRPTNTLIFLINEAGDTYVSYGKPEPETDVVFGTNSGVIQTLAKTNAPIYLQPGKPWPLELRTDRARLGIIRVMVIDKMAGTDRINGFACIGAPLSSANAYNFEELRFIHTLVGQLAVAIERDQVIHSLERRVRELDVLSQVGQAVNFTIERDDLVELISAQTLKLIPAPFFYVVLYESATEKLYYAFFLENDERDETRENQQWDIGDDLYSEIILKGQPRRLDNYIREMRLRGSAIRYENPDTKAWMGVPLIAGHTTLGVLVLGDSDPSVRYNDAQLRILGDIGALTATSLEKARLFSAANLRARQMAALNDISRQLVATEGDFERLLELITSSAVDILNAEAGSLLLTVEDESRDLEFKAAVGGTGHELIGTRLPAGYGLVGKVAETGKAVISNDTSKDANWDGEVAKDGAFRTKSVLAVPLIGKDRVVGVLEVINKKDGTVYVSEDVELLTTFAGQAAIAFENARLFQQTDIQLEQRVRELEVLERVDREMNRALDMKKVAEITVYWALEYSSATAGLLGILNEEQTHMEVVARIGYDPEDAPTTAEGDIWPLDYGIVKRVMRTRRSDLQPNVEIDPDYSPSLRGSLSQITVPMISADDIIAILILETSKDPRLNLLDLDWAQRLAEHASIAIANAQLYAELTRANESKSEFVGFAAHELKNPLTSVKGYTDTLLSPMGNMITDEQRREFLSVIRSNADRMQIIIEDLRDIAKIDAGQLTVTPSPIDVKTVIAETLQSYQTRIDEKHQKLVNNIDGALPLIMGDKMRLVQVLLNLISNANKYSPPESIITLDAVAENHHRNDNNKPIGPAMRLSVQDNGIGMGEDDLAQIFRVRYFRSANPAARTQTGTGLGMMITQEIIQQHGGRIWVESTLGEGTTFHMVIPLAPEDAIPPHTLTPSPEAQSVRGEVSSS